MTDNDETTSSSVSPFRSPTDKLQEIMLNLVEKCSTHNAKTFKNSEEKYALIKRVDDLYRLLDGYISKSDKKEIEARRAKMEQEITEIRKNTNLSITHDKMEELILTKRYEFAEELHSANLRILVNSPIFEKDVVGELDISDDEIVGLIRNEVRTDDGSLEYKP